MSFLKSYMFTYFTHFGHFRMIFVKIVANGDGLKENLSSLCSLNLCLFPVFNLVFYLASTDFYFSSLGSRLPLSREEKLYSRLYSTCSLLALQIAMSSTNIRVHRDSCLTSHVDHSCRQEGAQSRSMM